MPNTNCNWTTEDGVPCEVREFEHAGDHHAVVDGRDYYYPNERDEVLLDSLEDG